MKKSQPVEALSGRSSVLFFESPSDFRKWLTHRHDKDREAWVGFYKKGAPKKGVTYSEALDEALCFGWIDGVRKGIDPSSYKIRFSPRKSRSTWSRINIQRVEELKKVGRMGSPGLKAFDARDERRAGIYSFENAPRTLAAADEKTFRADRPAWMFFNAQPPGYRRTAIWWVISAKLEATRQRRLAVLMEDSRNHRRLGLLARPTKSPRS